MTRFLLKNSKSFMRQINCKHYVKECLKTSVYSYDLVAAELNLCKACEKKLRTQMIEQDRIEKEMKCGVYKTKTNISKIFPFGDVIINEVKNENKKEKDTKNS